MVLYDTVCLGIDWLEAYTKERSHVLIVNKAPHPGHYMCTSLALHSISYKLIHTYPDDYPGIRDALLPP
jgi:hypothetical protein